MKKKHTNFSCSETKMTFIKCGMLSSASRILFCGIVTLAIALLMGYWVIPYKIWEGVMKESKLIQGDNPRYNAWAKVPIPLFQRIYLFNVTNPEEVNKGGKPILQQLGPYIFQITLEKFDIVFNEGNGTFFYRERIQYFYREDLSNGSEFDHITIVNVPFVGLAQEASTLDTISRYFLLEIMKEHSKEQLYLQTTVGKILFRGIHLPFIKDLTEIKGESILPNHTFGLFHGQNGTDQGRFEIYSGQKHPERFGDIASWNGKSEFDWWANDKYCNKLNGSDGVFEPYATTDRVYYMFMPGMCRSFPFEYEKGRNTQVFGVPVYKYSVPKKFLQNPKDNPENSCYFAAADQLLENPPESGVFPMRGCGRGPMVLSQPHFYQGSSVYLNQSIGLHPEQDKHEMSMFMEPYTGTPMRVNVRFQMNVDLSPNKYFKSLKKIPKMVHPLFWMDQTSEIPEKDADTIRNKLVFALQIIFISTNITIFIGALLISISFILYTRKYQRNNSHKIITTDSGTVKNKGCVHVLNHHVQQQQQQNTISSNSSLFHAKEMLLFPCPSKLVEVTPVAGQNDVEEQDAISEEEEKVPFFNRTEILFCSDDGSSIDTDTTMSNDTGFSTC